MLKLKLTTTLSCLGTLSFMISCKPPADESTVSYAHANDLARMSLAIVPPNGQISLCNQGGMSAEAIALVKRAVLEWAQPIGRDKYLTVAEGCGADYMVNLTQDRTHQACVEGAAAFAGPMGFIGGNRPGQAWGINACQPHYSLEYDVMGHEVGHLWGQCDRYGKESPGHPVRGQGCADPGPGSDGNYTAPSLMQSAGFNNPGRVTEDDAKGMQALAARTDIPGYQEWQQFLQGNPQSRPSDPSQAADPGPGGGGARIGAGGSAPGTTPVSDATSGGPPAAGGMPPLPPLIGGGQPPTGGNASGPTQVFTAQVCTEMQTLPRKDWSSATQRCQADISCALAALLACSL